MQHQRDSAVALWAAGQGQDTPPAPSTRRVEHIHMTHRHGTEMLSACTVRQHTHIQRVAGYHTSVCIPACWPTLPGHEGCTALHQPSSIASAQAPGASSRLPLHRIREGCMHHEGNCNCRPDGNCRQGNVGVPALRRRSDHSQRVQHTAHTNRATDKGWEPPTAADATDPSPPGPPSHEEGGCPNNAMT